MRSVATLRLDGRGWTRWTCKPFPLWVLGPPSALPHLVSFVPSAVLAHSHLFAQPLWRSVYKPRSMVRRSVALARVGGSQSLRR